MNEPKTPCPIWKTPALRLGLGASGSAKVHSPRAGGDYQITGTAAMTVQHRSAAEKARITTWIVDQRRSGEPAPLVTDDIIQQAATRRSLRMSERKQRFFLLSMSRNFQPSDQFRIGGIEGEEFKRDVGDIASWTECSDDNEVYGIIRLLAEEGLVIFIQPACDRVRLTAKGFERMEALETSAPQTRQVFVAMWFDQSMDAAFDSGFDPAITDAGYRALRIDRKEHGNKIDDEIIAEIRRSRFVVADFTCETVGMNGSARALARGGVYYEAGFAQGLGIPVIWSSDLIVLAMSISIRGSSTTSSGTNPMSFVRNC